ncbi:phage tail tube protein [Oenococcus sicerae]|uniref:phage tail tube protein n=1 Tax=Oenococcus sicerae TaxID=2203724 RepID=UPI0039E9AB33
MPQTATTPVFTHNWKNDVEIDINGNQDPSDTSNSNFKSLKDFMTTLTPTPGDVIDNASYYGDKDNTNSEVTGHNRSWAVAGNVLQGDPACDFVQSLEDSDAVGNAAKTLVRFTKANGTVKIYNCSLENIVTIGGNGNTKSNLTFTIDANGPAVVSTATAVTGVTLDKTTLSGKVGDTGKVTATVTPEGATNKGVTFTSSDKSVATIDNSGSYSLIKAGTTVFTAKTDDGGETATCAVTVTTA